ncbi:uL15 family ribosomal protein [Candidatus Woesearchaeota archaeon]|nr:uL15 family ribosomal protein [Candidatus Woesearchaeota archaeon]
MTTHKRKKLVKYRGSHTHGGGAKKKRRGSGNRGGRGMAGTGKRADSKKPSINVATYFGKHGFIKKNANIVRAINLEYFEVHMDDLVAQSKAEKKADGFHIDLSTLGYDKLLGGGQATKKYHFTVRFAAAGAIEKVKQAGGQVAVLEGKAAPEPVKDVKKKQ